jgi:ribose transport system substrate-binding protein
MKKRFLVLLLAMAFVFAACNKGGTTGGGGRAASGDGITVGFSIKNLNNPYMITMEATMQELAKERGFNIISVNAQADAVKQQADVEDLLSRGIDLLIADSQDPVAIIATSRIVAAAGVPLFLLNTSVDPSATYVTLVQSNNVMLGSLTGEWLGNNVSGELRIGLLSGNPGNMVGYARRSGFIQGLTEAQLARNNSTNFRVLTQGWGNWSAEGGLSAAEDMLVSAPSINVIFAENDAKALGAIRAIRNAGREGQVTVLSVDGQREALEAIRTGTLHATGLNSPIELARTVVDIALRYHSGERGFPTLVNTTPAVITSRNVGEYYNPDIPFGFKN